MIPGFAPIGAYPIGSFGGPPGITGTGAFTLDALTVAGAGDVALLGTSAFTLAGLTLAGVGEVTTPLTLSGGFTLGDLTSTAAGSVALAATGAFAVQGLVVSAAGATAIAGFSYFALAADPIATNLVSYSKQAQNAAWNPIAVTKTNVSTPDPDGNTGTVVRLTANSNVNGRAELPFVLPLKGAHNGSVQIRNVDSTVSQIAVYDNVSAFAWRARATWSGATLVSLTGFSGGPTNLVATDLGGGWYRISAAGSIGPTGPAQQYFLVAPDVDAGTKSVEVTGAQVSPGSALAALIETKAGPASAGGTAITLTGAGATAIAGIMSVPLSDLTLAGLGDVGIAGSAGFTIAPLTLAGSGAVALDGTGAVQIADLTSTAAGEVALVGSSAFALSDLTLSGAVAVGIAGTLAFVLQDLALSGAGATGINGAAAFTLAPISLAATGEVGVQGAGAFTLADLTAAAVGAVPIDGGSAFTFAPITVSGVAAVPIDGSAAFILSDLTLAGVITPRRSRQIFMTSIVRGRRMGFP